MINALFHSMLQNTLAGKSALKFLVTQLSVNFRLPNIIGLTNSRIMIWVGQCIGFWCGYLSERYHLEDLSLDGRLIVK
jgi:succinate-acetate transporter protein